MSRLGTIFDLMGSASSVIALIFSSLCGTAGNRSARVKGRPLVPVRIIKKVKKGSPYSITERKVPELIPVLGSQPAGDMSHKPGGRRPLLSARPAVTPATLKRAATNFAAW